MWWVLLTITITMILYQVLFTIATILLQVLNHKNQDIRPPAASSTGGEVSTEQVVTDQLIWQIFAFFSSFSLFHIFKICNYFFYKYHISRCPPVGAAPSPNPRRRVQVVRTDPPSSTSSQCKSFYIFWNIETLLMRMVDESTMSEQMVTRIFLKVQTSSPSVFLTCEKRPGKQISNILISFNKRTQCENVKMWKC